MEEDKASNDFLRGLPFLELELTLTSATLDTVCELFEPGKGVNKLKFSRFLLGFDSQESSSLDTDDELLTNKVIVDDLVLL